MKKFSVLLFCSLAANVGLFAAWMVSRRPAATVVAPPAATVRPPEARGFSTTQLDVLRSGDAEVLRRAGVAPEVIRDLLAGRAYARLQARMASIQRRVDRGRSAAFWKNNPGIVGLENGQAFRDLNRVQREYQDEMQTLFGEASTMWFGVNSVYGMLPAAKRAQLQKIEQDYAEMQSALYADAGGVFLTSDQKRVELLQQEKQRDIQALLTTEELAQVELRNSSSAQWVQQTVGAGIEKEADYRAIVALRKAFEDRFATGAGPNATAEFWQQRSQAEQALSDQIREVLGADAYAHLRRTTDQEYQILGTLERRLSLPAGTADSVYGARDRYAELSQAINDDATLPAGERRRLLQALGEQARGELAQSLGLDGVDFYRQRSAWLHMLAGGNAFSTDLSRAPALGNRTVVSPVAAKSETPSVPPKG